MSLSEFHYVKHLIGSRDTGWVLFLPFITWLKIKIKSFSRCKVQVSVHMSLELPGRHIRQSGYIPSSTALVFGLGHDMGSFCPLCTRIYTTSTAFFIIFKGSKKDENMMSCARLYVKSTETLLGKGRKRRLISPQKEWWENMRGNNSFLIITTSKGSSKHSKK